MSDSGVQRLDLQDLQADLKAFGARLCQAWKNTGFVVITGHGIDLKVIDNCLDAARNLFGLPLDIKQRYHDPSGGGQRGYTPFGIETAKDGAVGDLKEFWHVGREINASHPASGVLPANVWPEEVPEFRRSCLSFYQAMDDLGRQLLKAVAMELGESPDYVESRVANGNSILRLLHYPPCDTSTPGERAAAHEDINVITLLVGADQAGLEILRRDRSWMPIQTVGDEIVCNVGDMLERLTNNILRSTTHRVVRPASSAVNTSRYAIPFFLHFAPEVEIRSLPSCVSLENPDLYPTPITAQTFLSQRLAEIGLT